MGLLSTWKLGKAAVLAATAVLKVCAFVTARGLPALEIVIATVRRVLELQTTLANKPGADRLLALIAWFRQTWPALADSTRIDELLELLATAFVELFKRIQLFRGKTTTA
jgi:hypothetical protein